MRSGTKLKTRFSPTLRPQSTMEANSKKRKIAVQSLSVELQVDIAKAHAVNDAGFDKWHKNTKTILDTAMKDIAVESAKFKKFAIFQPYDWRQTRVDTAPH